jgi:hypothetical protein
LRFQGFQHFPDRFRSTVEDGRVFEIKEIQPAKRTGFPPAHISTRNVLSDLPFHLNRQKVTEMFPEKLFKFLLKEYLPSMTSVAYGPPTRAKFRVASFYIRGITWG